MENKHESHDDNSIKSKANIALVVFFIIAAFFLVTEHRAHIAGWLPYWPYLLLLACPLMHVFMHGGHGHKDHGAGDASNQSTKEKQ